jgi:hypothetical protein
MLPDAAVICGSDGPGVEIVPTSPTNLRRDRGQVTNRIAMSSRYCLLPRGHRRGEAA